MKQIPTHVHDTTRGHCIEVSEGRPLPLGVYDCCDGFNFAVFSRHATSVELLLFDDTDSAEPSATIRLDPPAQKTGDIWHLIVRGVRWGQAYAFRVHGPSEPERGLRFDHSKLLLDPYALAIGGTRCFDHPRIMQPGLPATRETSGVRRSPTRQIKNLLVDRRFDWDGAGKPRTPWSKTVIYETHVRGLTIHPSSCVAHPGTFLGVIQKIPYLRSLGITALELMPVQEFNEAELIHSNPASGERLRNYWGYSPVALFAPNEGYATQPGTQVQEFKTMVRELHRAGIEVILDVVFNHTAEGDETGPTLSFRGLDNPIYYLLDPDPRFYANYSGCGNTLNCNHPVVRNLVIDCLRYWVSEMRVDGFRFDLASILGRDSDGHLMSNPPLLEQIAEDPILRDTKLIAEAWDAAGAYQVGSFPGTRWSEWNAHYRDDVRRFWRGDSHMVGRLASRLCGSADLYEHNGEQPVNGVNFVTCHDGFTLADLVSFSRKHNEPNGHGNRDGADENYSANHGIEGPTEDRGIDALRLRQSKNMLATLLLSRGVPMILGGDEFRRSQRGNSNAYCQDNEISWYDWNLVEQNAELVRFIRRMIALRGRYPVLSAERFYNDAEICWFGPSGEVPDWGGASNTLGCVIREPFGGSEDACALLCLLFNADAEVVHFTIPVALAPRRWRVAVDTGKAPPWDIAEPGVEAELESEHCRLEAHSAVVLCSVRE